METRKSLSILIVDDEAIVHQTIGGYLRQINHDVTGVYDAAAALELLARQSFDLALYDLKMPGLDGMALLDRTRELCPDLPVIIVTGHGTMDMAIQALRLGAADFIAKPVRLAELEAMIERCLQIRRLRQDRRRLREAIRGMQDAEDFFPGGRGLIGNSQAITRIKEQICQAVEAECDTILITGETGTGKELVAREIHYQAASAEVPFITVSCPVITDTLFESSFFGHVKGSFTGAMTDQPGYFERADSGTLFLDEIADIPVSAQSKFLRVLETRKFWRMGGVREIAVKVRVIAATNHEIEPLVEKGDFRRDLFYRLNVFTLHLPPLRERREDILPLADYFLTRLGKKRRAPMPRLSPAVRDLLRQYHFPGNVRELRNLIERAVILCRGEEIKPDEICLGAVPQPRVFPPETATTKTEAERQRLLQALNETHWNRRKAALLLQMPYSSFRYKLDRLGIE